MAECTTHKDASCDASDTVVEDRTFAATDTLSGESDNTHDAASAGSSHESSQPPRRLMAIPGVFYGGGCSYMACRGLMMGGIEDVLLITHGPVGCAYFSGINAYKGVPGAPMPTFATRTFSTHMDESDVIFGGDDKLATAIDEAVERFHPEAIAICATCPVGLIGDDIESVARDAAERHQVDILPLSCEGFKSEPGWLHGGKQILDNWVGRESRGAGEFSLHYMSESCEGEQGRALRDIFDRVGYDLVCSLMGVTTYRDIVRSQEAKLVVLDSGKQIDQVPQMYKQRYGAGFMRVAMTGIGNIAASLRAMAAFFNDTCLMARTEQVIAEESARIEGSRQRAREEFQGIVVAVFEDIFRSNDFAVLSSELGMDVVMIAQNYESEVYTEEGFTVHVPTALLERVDGEAQMSFGLGCATEVSRLPGCPEIDCADKDFSWRCVNLDRGQVSDLLEMLAPDLCFAAIEEKFGCAGATMRSERFLSDERGTDYVGFGGLDRYATDFAMARDMSHWVLETPGWMCEHSGREGER